MEQGFHSKRKLLFLLVYVVRSSAYAIDMICSWLQIGFLTAHNNLNPLFFLSNHKRRCLLAQAFVCIILILIIILGIVM